MIGAGSASATAAKAAEVAAFSTPENAAGKGQARTGMLVVIEVMSTNRRPPNAASRTGLKREDRRFERPPDGSELLFHGNRLTRILNPSARTRSLVSAPNGEVDPASGQ
jgi:hypothetical protein